MVQARQEAWTRFTKAKVLAPTNVRIWWGFWPNPLPMVQSSGTVQVSTVGTVQANPLVSLHGQFEVGYPFVSPTSGSLSTPSVLGYPHTITTRQARHDPPKAPVRNPLRSPSDSQITTYVRVFTLFVGYVYPCRGIHNWVTYVRLQVVKYLESLEVAGLSLFPPRLHHLPLDIEIPSKALTEMYVLSVRQPASVA